MLTHLVTLLKDKENGLSLAEISRTMNAQPTAVMAMITLLVQKGKLVEIGPDGKSCAACGLQSDCNLLAARGKRYTCASRSPTQDNKESAQAQAKSRAKTVCIGT